MVTVFLAPLLAFAQTSCPQFSTNLSRGSRGSDVVHLQQYLISQHLLSSDSATGYFGPLTEAAVQHWQSAHGIVSSGTPVSTGYGAVGPRTRNAMANCADAVSTSASNSSVSTASLIQSLLAQLQVLQARIAALKAQQSTAPDQTAEVSGTLFPAAVTGTSVSCTFNGQSVANGASATAYQDPAGAYGSQCVSEQRTCANGTLSGSYTNASCAAGSATSCFFSGQNINSGSSVTAYQSDVVSTGKICKSQQRTCSNGKLSGTYVYSSCSVGTVSSGFTCDFNGYTVQNGASIIAYQSSSVSSGSCVSQTRTCANGTLSGSYAYNSCTVNSAGPTVTLSQSANTTTSDGATGQTFTVSWSSSGASSCTVQKTDPAGVTRDSWATGTSGSQSASPYQAGTHHWWIDCTGSNGGTAHADMYHTVSYSSNVCEVSDRASLADCVNKANTGTVVNDIRVTGQIVCTANSPCDFSLNGISRPFTLEGTSPASGFKRDGTSAVPELVIRNSSGPITVKNLTFDEGPVNIAWGTPSTPWHTNYACGANSPCPYTNSIELLNVKNTTIDFITVLESKDAGINLDGCQNVTIKNSTFTHPWRFGIFLDDHTVYPPNFEGFFTSSIRIHTCRGRTQASISKTTR